MTTEIVSLSADPTSAPLRSRASITVWDFPAGCWQGSTPPSRTPPRGFAELSEQKAEPGCSPAELGARPRGWGRRRRDRGCVPEGVAATRALGWPGSRRPGTAQGNSTRKRSPAALGGPGAGAGRAAGGGHLPARRPGARGGDISDRTRRAQLQWGERGIQKEKALPLYY